LARIIEESAIACIGGYLEDIVCVYIHMYNLLECHFQILISLRVTQPSLLKWLILRGWQVMEKWFLTTSLLWNH